jgi:hypothetical protein
VTDELIAIVPENEFVVELPALASISSLAATLSEAEKLPLTSIFPSELENRPVSLPSVVLVNSIVAVSLSVPENPWDVENVPDTENETVGHCR